jgi:hypothetical protein
MAFTITDAKTLAHSWIEETLDDAQILIHGNEFIRRIVSDKAWGRKTATYTKDDIPEGETKPVFNLPADFYRLVKIETLSGYEVDGDIYEISNSKITFKIQFDFIMTYVAYPAALTAITGEGSSISLPDIFLYPLAEFLIFKYFNVELDDGDSKAAAMEYEQRCANSLREIYSQMDIDSEGDGFQVKMRW